LVIGTTRLTMEHPTADASRIRDAIARLVELSRKLARLEIPVESQMATLGQDELQREPDARR
jgi:hypothetical protein